MYLNESTNCGNYFYVYYSKLTRDSEDPHFTRSFEPHEGLAVCRAKEGFSIYELLVARSLISPRLMNWEERYSGTWKVRHLKAVI